MGEPDRSRELVQRASRGDAPAVDELLALHLPGLERFVRREAGALVAAHDRPSDVVQSACREVLEHIDRFRYDGEDGFRRWLYRTALRKLQDRHRYWQAEKRDAMREVRAGPMGTSGSAPRLEELLRSLRTPSQDAVMNEEYERVRQACDELPDRYREIILFAQVEGLRHAEIAERMQISETNARVLLSRALARLARLLRADADESEPE